MPGRPAETAVLSVMRDLARACRTGTRVHFQPRSTARSVARVRQAKADGLPVSCEATTHHFTLTHAECASYDPVFKVNPPLRTDADVAAVRAGLGDGSIDCIATDHAPHTQEAKEARSEEHTSELQSLMRISYAVFCLKKKTSNTSNKKT